MKQVSLLLFPILLCFVVKGSPSHPSSPGVCREAANVPCSSRQHFLPDAICILLGCCLRLTVYGRACFKNAEGSTRPTASSMSPQIAHPDSRAIPSRHFGRQVYSSSVVPPTKQPRPIPNPTSLIELAVLAHFAQKTTATTPNPPVVTAGFRVDNYVQKPSESSRHQNEAREPLSPQNNGNEYTLDEERFLSQIEEELFGLDMNSMNIANTDVISPGNIPIEAEESSRAQQSQDSHPANGLTYAPSNPSSSASSNEIIALLEFVGSLERWRQNNAEKTSRTCTRDQQDSCCLTNPTSSCCKFTGSWSSTNRAAPLTRVVGGSPAEELRYSVAHLSRLPYREHFCGGTILNEKWVLTAAHCVLEYCGGSRQASEILVSLGKYRKATRVRDHGQQDIPVQAVMCHPDQCKSSRITPRLNDMALLHLMWPARFSTTVTPALMPTQYEVPSPSRSCIFLGYGNTEGTGYENVIKQVTVPYIPNKMCNQPNWRNCSVRACMMCAGDIHLDPCIGDSGGPLFCERSNGLFVLHGVYSWGRCGREARKPAVYSRASYFVDWVAGVMEEFSDTSSK